MYSPGEASLGILTSISVTACTEKKSGSKMAPPLESFYGAYIHNHVIGVIGGIALPKGWWYLLHKYARTFFSRTLHGMCARFAPMPPVQNATMQGCNQILPLWIKFYMSHYSKIIRHHLPSFVILIRTVFHERPRKLAVFDRNWPWKTVRINVASFRESS